MREIKPHSFVFEIPKALPGDVCREIIRRFEVNVAQQTPGRIGVEQAQAESIKNTTDIYISGHDDWKDIDAHLRQSMLVALREAIRHFPFFAANRFKDLGYNVQRYRAGEYYHWHVDSGPGEFMSRQLVAIWYLNGVTAGGETEFDLQQVSVTPEEGKLVLFPPFWTHVHRAVTVREGTKYIATTWLCFA